MASRWDKSPVNRNTFIIGDYLNPILLAILLVKYDVAPTRRMQNVERTQNAARGCQYGKEKL